MKKDIKKELGISGGFTMTSRQIKNRTATYLINCWIPFEEEIERVKRDNEKVQRYTTWTAEEKERCNQRSLETIKSYEERLAKYGTKEKEAEHYVKMITNSNAFADFKEAVGIVSWTVEKRDICYYLRFFY